MWVPKEFLVPGLVDLAVVARTDIVHHIRDHAGPVEVAPEIVESFGAAPMATSGGVVGLHEDATTTWASWDAEFAFQVEEAILYKQLGGVLQFGEPWVLRIGGAESVQELSSKSDVIPGAHGLKPSKCTRVLGLHREDGKAKLGSKDSTREFFTFRSTVSPGQGICWVGGAWDVPYGEVVLRHELQPPGLLRSESLLGRQIGEIGVVGPPLEVFGCEVTPPNSHSRESSQQFLLSY